LAIFVVALAWSGIRPFDRYTWVLEVAPALIALPILAFTYRKFPLTHLVYALILLHAIVLMVGGHFTYAREPVFEWLMQVMHWPRNNFDKLGHFMQGFVPAMIAREILLRRTPLKRGGWLFFLVVCVCGSISACYELVEWLTAVLGGGKSEEFLGTQGYVWDTQSDMLMAFIGAITAQLTLSRVQDRQLARMGVSN
jgi:putative membrane protein